MSDIANMGHLFEAISASLENGDRLLEDAQYLLDFERYPTAYALSILAQEEFAKAFLLHLIDAGAIPWNSEVRRTLRDHTCKQLFAVVMDFLEPDFDEFIRRLKGDKSMDLRFPARISGALNIIRYEKVPRQDESAWKMESDPSCDPQAREVADGQIDKRKQDALYVRLAKNGQVASIPSRIGATEATEEFEKAARLGRVLSRHEGEISCTFSLEYEMIAETFKVLFELQSVEEYNKHWWA
ncbi:MAG: hypothetical protein COT13_05845 [Chloroflexi bacterium CG08_land_8_20_14_0_20_45_12]|nr:MAG: hypothetical protein COT13_05845 [Chloroflexi bacterium CG08_land_8_20_14_0_20_45_12]